MLGAISKEITDDHVLLDSVCFTPKIIDQRMQLIPSPYILYMRTINVETFVHIENMHCFYEGLLSWYMYGLAFIMSEYSISLSS